MFDKVLEFHKAFNLPIDKHLSLEELKLRFDLQDEEHQEVSNEMAELAMSLVKPKKDLRKVKANLTKEICDQIYVLCGTAVALGLPLDKAFAEVHRSNMSKLDDDGKAIYREDGKVLKSKNYTPANMEQFFE